MYAIRRVPDHQLFLLRDAKTRWTEDAALAVHFADEQIAQEQAERLPYPVCVVPVSNHD
jgi:hypothetical protein